MLQGNNVVEIKTVIPPSCVVGDALPIECGITIIKAYRLDMDATLKLLQTDQKYCRQKDVTLRMIMNQFVASSGVDGIDVTDVKVPLTCPVCWIRLSYSDSPFLSTADEKTTGTAMFRCKLQTSLLF